MILTEHVDRPTSVEDVLSRIKKQEEDRKTAGQPTIAHSVFHVKHGTRLGSPGEGPADEDPLYFNRYVLVRVGDAFGACSFEEGAADESVADYSGRHLLDLLHPDVPAPVRMAAADAWLAHQQPHRNHPLARAYSFPTGTPMQRAIARDRGVLNLLNPQPQQRIAVVGVVTPMIREMVDSGAHPVLCDRNIDECLGMAVHSNLEDALVSEGEVDALLVTGMTVVDGSFDRLREFALSRGIPMVVYAQSGSAIVREFLGAGVTGLHAEHFPFSQFSADKSPCYSYSADAEQHRAGHVGGEDNVGGHDSAGVGGADD